MLKSIHNLFLLMLCSCLLHTFILLVGLALLERSRHSLEVLEILVKFGPKLGRSLLFLNKLIVQVGHPTLAPEKFFCKILTRCGATGLRSGSLAKHSLSPGHFICHGFGFLPSFFLSTNLNRPQLFVVSQGVLLDPRYVLRMGCRQSFLPLLHFSVHHLYFFFAIL